MSLLTNTQESISLSSAEFVNLAVRFSVVYGAACAAWKMPGEDQMHLILDLDGASEVNEFTLEDISSGFLMAPFDDSKGILHIRNDIHINLATKEISSLSLDHREKFKEFIKNQTHESKQYVQTTVKRSESLSSEHFIEMVNKAISNIRLGAFQKVVPSRYKKVALNDDFDRGDFFGKLCKSYPGAFTSLVYTPTSGLWLGATPELLLELKANTFKTVSLAGTQKFTGQSLTDVAWTQKEIEEQALVSRYIINCFKKIRLREFDENGPKTVKAGNLIHLKTEFTVDMESTNFHDLGSVMLKLLHPTSAICGMPLNPSLEFIHKHENYDRGYFSGYLGPVDFDNSTSLFVNLRCMTIAGNTATLYAGAGVTADSNPEKEWQETEMKMNTLLNLIY
ncbi:MAG: chorismate-binding protein [Bacteroidota bacterium]